MNLSTTARLSRALVMTLAITAPGLALAQAANPPPPPGQDNSAAGPWGHGPMMHRDGSPEVHRLKAIHDILGITPSEESAFLAFTTAMQPASPPPGEMDIRGDRGPTTAMTTPERLDHMAKRMDEREAMMRAHFQRVETATKTLYAELSPDQKRIMDALPELMRGGHHGWGHHGGHPGAMGPAPDGGSPEAMSGVGL